MTFKGTINPFETEIRENKIEGERLVALLRIVGLFLIIPAYLIRIYCGDVSSDYLLFAAAKWILIVIYSFIIYIILKRNIYHSSFGYFTLFMDLIFLSISLITLSLFKMNHNGTLNDPIFLGFYVFAFSSVIRFDYRYSIFSIILSCALISILAFFDQHYHAIKMNYTMISDRVIALLLITIFSLIFIKKLKGIILSWHQVMKQHAKEISTILKIGKDITSNDELEKTLSIISQESKELLSSDLSFISLLDDESNTYLNTAIFGINKKSLKRQPDITDGVYQKILYEGKTVLINNNRELKNYNSPDFHSLMNKENISYYLGVPIKIDGSTVGALQICRRGGMEYSDNDTLLLSLLSEQAAISIKNERLLKKLQNENIYLHQKLKDISQFENIIGESRVMQSIYDTIEKAARTEIPVLIRGESGTGKELVASALYNKSERRDKPYIKINCAAIPESLLESELFGYEKGAFTDARKQKKGKFELADTGTIFLDEIGDMSLNLQIKLLRVLQEKEFERLGGESSVRVDVRLITATNQDLEKKIAEGKFREDLFYRVNGLTIFIPPLRDRKEDIPLLACHFLEKYCLRSGRKSQFSKSAIKLLINRKWKGNVRELENLIHRQIVLTDKEIITDRDIKGIDIDEYTGKSDDTIQLLEDYTKKIIEETFDFSSEMEKFEKELIKQALEISVGNIRKAGKILNIPKSTLFYKINKYNINKGT